MKKIINGRLYNTETAEEITDSWNGYGRGDFYYVCETLYKKKTGEFFLFAEGGALTDYANYHGGNRTFGQQIIPLTCDEAKEWAMNNMKADDFMQCFGEVEE